MFGKGREYKASVSNFSLLKSQTFLFLVTGRGNIIKQTINQTTELHYSDIKNATLALGNCLYSCLYICLFTWELSFNLNERLRGSMENI